MRNEVLSGYQGYGMPTPEEEFKRVTGEDFDSERYEILYNGADNDIAADDPYVPYTIVEKEKVNEDRNTAQEMSEEEVVLEGTIAPGMPTPEEAFKAKMGFDFDDDNYRIVWDGAENYVEDDTYTPYKIVRISKVDDKFKTYSDEEIERAYRTAVDNAVALYRLPEPTDSYEKKAYNEEYVARSEEIRKALEILSPVKIKEAEVEIARKTNSKEELNIHTDENVVKKDESSSENIVEDENSKKDNPIDYSKLPEEVLDNRLKQISEEVSNFADEMDENDPRYIEYWALVNEKNRRRAKTKEETKKESGKDYIIDPNGGNINFTDKEVKDAISDYMGNTKKEADNKVGISKFTDDTPENSNVMPKKNKKFGILRRVVSKFNIIPLIATAAALVVSAFGHTTVKSSAKDEEVKKAINTSSSVSYSISTEDTKEDIYETPEEAVKRTLSEMKTGDKINMNSGTEYHYSSDYEYAGYDRTGKFGSDIRKDGEYTLDYVSIIDPATGLIRNVEYNKGQNVEDFIDKTSRDIGIDRDKLDIKFEIGGPVTGWIDYDDYVSCVVDGEVIPELVETKVVPGKSITGQQDNFDSIVNFVDENGNNATANFKKVDGSYYKVGDKVNASNGETYRIDKFDIETETKEDTVVIPAKKKIEHDKLTFGLSNISLLEALGAAAISLIGIPLTARRRKEETRMSDIKFKNLVGMGGFEPTTHGEYDYSRSWWDGLTYNSDKVSYVPQDGDEIDFSNGVALKNGRTK